MPNVVRADIDRERDRAWYGDPSRKSVCPNCGYSTIADAHTYFNIGFTFGARWAIRRTTELSPHIAKFVELIIWLFEGDKDEIISSDIERQSTSAETR